MFQERSPVDIMTEVIIWRIHNESSKADVEGEESLSYSAVPNLHKYCTFVSTINIFCQLLKYIFMIKSLIMA
jgi:hypothetical protein